MKIIGKTSSGFLIEATENQIAEAMGYHYASQNGCPKIEIGATINVSNEFKRLRDIEANKGKIKEAKKSLQQILESLDKTEPLLMQAGVIKTNG